MNDALFDLPGQPSPDRQTPAPAGTRLHTVPMLLREANRYVSAWHRHHRPARGCLFCLAVADPAGAVHGVAIVSRPVAHHLQDGLTAEVVRTATDGTRNANSHLYGAARRAAWTLGYRRLVTYTQDGETGASLRAAGYRPVADLPARPTWAESSVALRHLRDQAATSGGIARTRWETTR